MRSISVKLMMIVLIGLGSTVRAETPVLVLPFADARGGSGTRWVESSIQQSLVGDVGREGAFKPVTATLTGNPSDDLAAAITAARQANAPYVVFGSYDVRGDQMRVVANALDVERMTLVGAVRVGRSTRDIFGATDALGSHVLEHLNTARNGAAHGNRTGGLPFAPTNAISMPLASLPMGYGDLAGQANPRHTGNVMGASLLPRTLLVDDPAFTNQIAARTRNTMEGGDGNRITRGDGNTVQRGDGNQITGGDGNSITGGDGNTIQRGDGNTLSPHFGEGSRPERQFGNTMRTNTGDGTRQRGNMRGVGDGIAVNGQTGGAVRSNSGNAVRSNSGNAVGAGSGRAVTPGSGNAVNPPKER